MSDYKAVGSTKQVNFAPHKTILQIRLIVIQTDLVKFFFYVKLSKISIIKWYLCYTWKGLKSGGNPASGVTL